MKRLKVRNARDLRRVEVLAEELWQINKEIDELKTQREELRESIIKKMVLGDKMKYTMPDNQDYTLTYSETPVKVLKSNKKIFKIIGEKNFIEIAKVTLGALRSIYSKTETFVDHIDARPELELRRVVKKEDMEE
jgi:hypothetical protein